MPIVPALAPKPDPQAGVDEPRSLATRFAPVAVASALFMEFIDSTSLSTALPTLARAFHSDPVHLKLALTSYILALAMLAPASGWVADRFGAKKVFLSAMGVFLAGSCLCGLSHSLGQLVAARLLQGAGGAMMTPVGRLIIVGSTPKERLVQAMASFAMPALVGPLIGPPLAGFILAVADWPWIFLVNLPVGIAGMIAVSMAAPKLEKLPPRPFDLPGFLLSLTAVAALMMLSESVGLGLVPVWGQALLALVGGVSLYLFVRHCLAVAHPLLDVRLFASAAFRASVVGGSLVRLGLGAMPFLTPLLLQVGLGWTPVQAGFVTIAHAAGAMGAKPFSSYLVRSFGFRRLLIATAAGTALTTASMAVFKVGAAPAAIFALLLVGGFVRSTQFTAVNVIAFAGLKGSEVGKASALAMVCQQLSIGFGVSFGALLLHIARGGEGALTPDRFTMPFMMVGGAALLAVIPYLHLSRNAGEDVGGA